MFIALARDYHERWGIENGFRDVKARFLSKGRSRRPVVRQFRWVLGLMLYNRWEVERKRQAVAWFRGKGDRGGLFDRGRPWKQRRHEQECPCLPTAVGFLVDAWAKGIKSVLKSKILKEKLVS